MTNIKTTLPIERVDGPAIEKPDGTKYWFLNGQLQPRSLINALAIDAAIKATVPGSKWYYQEARIWHEVTVAKVTKTLVILTTGERIPKGSRFAYGKTWFPPTPAMYGLYETQQLRVSSLTLYREVMRKIEAVASNANPNQLRELVTKLESIL